MGSGTISVVELAEAADKYPQLLGKALRDRCITVTGVLQKALVKGVGSHDLILDLEGTRKRKITFTSDVKSYARANSSLNQSATKFQKIGREIVVYESAPTVAKGSSSAGVIQKMLRQVIPAAPQVADRAGENQNRQQALVERVLFRELDTVTLDGIFQHITNAAVLIEWRPSRSF